MGWNFNKAEDKSQQCGKGEGNRLNKNERKISRKPNTLFSKISIDIASGSHIIKKSNFFATLLPGEGVK